MRKILVTTISFFSLQAFASGIIPYELDNTEIVHCESAIELNGREPSRGILPWSKKENGFDSFIIAFNSEGKVLYRFGNTQGQSFETNEEQAFALGKLIEKGTCPADSKL